MSGKSSNLAEAVSAEAVGASPGESGQSAELWQALFEHNACGQMILSPEGDIEAINAKACQMLGYPRDALLGTRCHALTHPGDLSSEMDHWRSLQSGALPHYRLELRFLKQNGSIVWCEVHMAMLRDTQGQARQATAVIHDISNRKQIERSLRERDVLLKSLDHIPGAIYKVLLPASGEPQLLYASSRAAEMYEVDPASMRLNWTTHYKRVHPDDLHMVTKLVEASLQHQSQPLKYEYRVIQPNKGVRWLSGEAVAQAMPDGGTAWYGYTTDITELKQGTPGNGTPLLGHDAAGAHAVTPIAPVKRAESPIASASTADATLAAVTEATMAVPTPVAPRTAKVLYAEDNEINVLLVEQIFKLRPQWELVVAPNGQAAMEQAKQDRPDVMLVDLHLGDMTGFELMDALDKDPQTRDITRVALSADAMPDSIRTAETQGFKDYLTKPLDVLALLRCLDDLLVGPNSAPPGALA